MNKVKILLMAGIISVGAIGSSVVYAASTSSYSTALFDEVKLWVD